MPIETTDTSPTARLFVTLKPQHAPTRATAMDPFPGRFTIHYDGTENAHEDARRLMGMEAIQSVEVIIDFRETTTYTRDSIQDDVPARPRAFMPTK